MVPYSLNSNSKRYGVLFSLFVTSLALQGLLTKVLASGPISVVVSSITLAGLFGVLFLVFDLLAWKWPGLIGFPLIPNWSGMYYGYIEDRHSYKASDSGVEYERRVEPYIPVTVKIEQTFSDIAIWLRPAGPTGDGTRATMSDCTMATMNIAAPSLPRLDYAFLRPPQNPGDAPIHGLGRWVREEIDGGYRLQGSYISDAMRKGRLDVFMLSDRRALPLFRRIEVIQNSVGAKYLGIFLEHADIMSFTLRLRKAVGRKQYVVLSENRRRRDGERYHITVVEPGEYPQIEDALKDNERVATMLSIPALATLIDVGTQGDSSSKTYFVVVNSAWCNRVREGLGLRKKDLHVTLGFNPNDIHGVPKDLSTRMPRFGW